MVVGEVGPQVNKFEQVSSDDNQKSVAGGGEVYPGPMLVGVHPTMWPIQWCILCYLSPCGQTHAQTSFAGGNYWLVTSFQIVEGYTEHLIHV